MRYKNANWTLNDSPNSWDQVNAAILMDIRDELQTLNRVIGCHNFLAIPRILRRISANTAKPRKRRKK